MGIFSKAQSTLLWIALMLFFMLTTRYYTVKYKKEKRDKQRITQSFAAANQQLVYYRAKNGQLVANNQVLQLKTKELEEIYPQLLLEIKNMNIKPKHVTNYSETVVQSEKHITTVIRDSVVNDTVLIRCFDYADEYYQVKGIAVNDSQSIHITSVDTLIQVVYKGKRKRPFLWVFSPRTLQQSISCKNPNATIRYAKNIEIIKK